MILLNELLLRWSRATFICSRFVEGVHWEKGISTEKFRNLTSMSRMVTYQNVEGHEDRKNTVVHLRPSADISEQSTPEIGHVIFFPGDVQDFETEMLEQPNCKIWVDWSYEKVIKIMSEKFPGCNIWLITPSKKIYKMFAIYKNFVKSESLFGVPEYSGDYGGLPHLEKLFKNVLNTATNDSTELADEFLRNESKIAILGFSKGCIVLNQLLYEVAWYTQNSMERNCGSIEHGPISHFVSRIKQLYWLDGGHSGQKDIWVRSKEVLTCLKHGLWSKDLKVLVHVTPYQVQDSIHPWKGQEESEFIAGLTDLGVDFEEKLHFETEDADDDDETIPPNRDELLVKHFEVMKVFR